MAKMSTVRGSMNVHPSVEGGGSHNSAVSFLLCDMRISECASQKSHLQGRHTDELVAWHSGRLHSQFISVRFFSPNLSMQRREKYAASPEGSTSFIKFGNGTRRLQRLKSLNTHKSDRCPQQGPLLAQ